ncbi:MAG: small multi-drug export protein, partial [Candidatus Cloacimonetes bacterium]|nr:small multi-drug export protein [Candidatus Cloacimonadota bacterium]
MPKHIRVLLVAVLLLLVSLPLFSNTLADKTVAWLSDKGLSATWIVLIISMLPLIELRGSIPVAILLFKLPWMEAVVLSVIGNMIPIPFILLFMDWFFRTISRNRHGARFTNWIFARTRRKGKAIEKYEAIGLAIFVGIPLPGTGAWTGGFAANIFGISFWKSLLYI